MKQDEAKLSLEKPLLGAVLCCTSIAPEDRVRLAQYAEQMGAEHKLDLTSDVTHLLVGSTDTPKYQYVAREREDVKVLRPEWVEAVRHCWMDDRRLDMNALEAEYRVPPLAGLRICITGFDDLIFRAQLQKNVVANGGEYTGDLTKEVTHLIAAKPEGKKYEYATMWHKKVVSLQWYKETLERGMQLDESSYHPTKSAEEQGVGAWNRQARTKPMIGKRNRDDHPPQEPARKLRRTASAKLGSQADNMWGDIVGQTSQQLGDKRDPLRTTKSTSDLAAPQQTETGGRKDDSGNTNRPKGFLCDSIFAILGFDERKEVLIHQTLQAAGATITTTATEMNATHPEQKTKRYMIVPHQTRPEELPLLEDVVFQPLIVTELWLERSMLQKASISLAQYPLGGIVTPIISPRITDFTVNATGFQSIETLHIAKTVNLTGAKYAETFTPKSSVLVCNSMNINQQKLFHANQWKVPAVSEGWLCRFLIDGAIPDFTSYLITGSLVEENDIEAELKQKRMDRDARRPPDGSGGRHDSNVGPKPSSRSDSFQSARASISEHADNTRNQAQGRDSPRSQNRLQKESGIEEWAALREISPNSPPKRALSAQLPGKKSLFQTYDGFKDALTNSAEHQTTRRSGENVQQPSPVKKSLPDAASMNSAIEDLLNMKAKAKANIASAQRDESKSKKKRLLSRALSNLSNASHASRHSRASSIDSLNTDGLGSEIAPPSGKSLEGTKYLSRKPSLQGRPPPNRPSSAAAAVNLPTSIHPTSVPIDLSDPLLLRDELDAPEEAPPLTQLGYEDNEEAVILREQLAEKRRARARLGQNAGDPKPEASINNKVKQRLREKEREREREKQVIRDDEILTASGWGGGGRTRAKNRSVDGMGDLDLF